MTRVQHLRSTEECEQMNAIYDMLDRLQPSASQLRVLYQEAALLASSCSDEDYRYFALFVYQLHEHVRRRLAKNAKDDNQAERTAAVSP